MYAEYFGLHEQPFNDTWDPRFYYSTEAHEDTQASLIYTVGSLKGLTVITGEAGTGKTLACQRMLAHFGRRISFAELGRNPLQEDNLFSLICAEFGIESTQPTEDGQIPVALQDFLLDQFASARPTVLIIDDAHFLSVGTLEKLRPVTNIETHEAKLIQIILLGQPDLVQTLNHPRLRHLRQRCFRSCTVGPLDRAQTGGYIQYRLAAAGGSNPDLFDDAAIGAVYEVSGGVIRLVNTICDNVMLSAFSKNTPAIDAELVRAVAKETMALNNSPGQFARSHEAAAECAAPIETGALSDTASRVQTVPATEGQLSSQLAVLEQKISTLSGTHASEIRIRELDSHLTRRIDELQESFERQPGRTDSANRESSTPVTKSTDAILTKLLQTIEEKFSRFDDLEQQRSNAGWVSSEARMNELDARLSVRLDSMVSDFERLQRSQDNATREVVTNRLHDLDNRLAGQLRSMESKLRESRTSHERTDRKIPNPKNRKMDSQLSRQPDSLAERMERLKGRGALTSKMNWGNGPRGSNSAESQYQEAVDGDPSNVNDGRFQSKQDRNLNDSLRRLRDQSGRTVQLAASLDKIRTHLVAAKATLVEPNRPNQDLISPARRPTGHSISSKEIDSEGTSLDDNGDQFSTSFDDDVRLRVAKLRSRAEATLPNLTPAGKLLDHVRSLSRLAEDS